MKQKTKDFLINNQISQYLLEFANSNIIVKTIAISIFWVIGLIPVWIYLLLRWLINPIDFWQELAVFLVCGITMGWIQFILLVIVIVLTIKAMTEDF
jgi:hypothetical protein